MIARWFASAAVLAFPLMAYSQGTPPPRINWSTAVPLQADPEGPLVRVWIPGSWTFRYGQPVPVMFEVSEDAHVAVLRVDGNGHLSVLWPTNRNLQTAARSGREYRITSPYSSHAAFHADYEFGQGMVVAIASYDPIDLTAFRRYRNDPAFYRNVAFQQPYIGGVRHIVDRITQEILYHPESAYDYDVAFYSVGGRSFFTNASYDNCAYDYSYGSRLRRYNPYLLYGFDDCYPGSSFYSSYWLACASWAAFTNGYAICRQWNPNWPIPPVAGPGPQPPAPTVNIGMIDSIMSRPVDKYPLLDRRTEQPTGTGTTHIVTMEPAAGTPNVTRWLPDDENAAISIPRLRRESQDRTNGSGRVSTHDEGYRSPGTTFRTSEPRAGGPPDRSGPAFMPPVRQPPREPAIWRDNGSIDRGASTHTPSPARWERPHSTQPQNHGGVSSPASTGHIDRGSTSTGTSSPAGAGAPRTDAGSQAKSGDSKTSGERKPH